MAYSDNDRCPQCQSTGVHCHSYDSDDNTYTMKCDVDDCGTTWKMIDDTEAWE